jgi:hypothetical protein
MDLYEIWNNKHSARRENSINLISTDRECLKDTVNELEINRKNENIRDLYRGVN